jgi:hypothetical protein
VILPLMWTSIVILPLRFELCDFTVLFEIEVSVCPSF